MKKLLAIAAGLAFAAALGLAPNAMGATAGGDAAEECGNGDAPSAGVAGLPDGSEPSTSGELTVCVNSGAGIADGAGRIGGSADGTPNGYVVADGDSDNVEQTRGYIGVEGSADGSVTPVSDGDDCNYDGTGQATDPEGVVEFVQGNSGDGAC